MQPTDVTNLRPVELGVAIDVRGDASGEWYTTDVYVPRDTPEDKIEERALVVFSRFDVQDVAHVWVYHVPSLEELDEEMVL